MYGDYTYDDEKVVKANDIVSNTTIQVKQGNDVYLSREILRVDSILIGADATKMHVPHVRLSLL